MSSYDLSIAPRHIFNNHNSGVNSTPLPIHQSCSLLTNLYVTFTKNIP